MPFNQKFFKSVIGMQETSLNTNINRFYQVEQATSKVRDPNLKFTLSFGIGLHHAGLVERDRSIVEDLFGLYLFK